MQTASNKSKMAGFTLREGREEEQWHKGSEIKTSNGQQLPSVVHLLTTWVGGAYFKMPSKQTFLEDDALIN